MMLSGFEGEVGTLPPKHDRVPELDLLRFMAATLVVFYHYSYRPLITGSVPSETAFDGLQIVSRYGYLGVQLFFLISGFVILWSAEGRTAKQFIILRFLRLYPMFWVAVAITLGVLWVAGLADSLLSLKVIAANLTLVPAYFSVPFVDGVYWTLAIELKFYLLIFLAIVLRQMPHIERWMYVWLAGLIIGSLTGDIALLKSLVLLPHGLYFVGGSICYLIRTRGLNWMRGGSLLFCAAASIHHAVAGRGDFTTVPQVASPLAVGMLVGAFYLILFVVSIRSVRIRSSSVLFWLGALTYPLYLLHNMIGKVVFRSLHELPDWVRLWLTLSGAYLLAWICARFIEPKARAFMACVIGNALQNLAAAFDSRRPNSVKK